MNNLEVKTELQAIFDLVDKDEKVEAMTRISLLIDELGGLGDLK